MAKQWGVIARWPGRAAFVMALVLLTSWPISTSVASSQPSLSREGDNIVESYTAVITVDADGVLEIDETYRLSFGTPTAAEHLSRTITTREQYDTDNDRLYDVSDIEASVDGEPADVAVDSDNGTESIAVALDSTDTSSPVVRLSYQVSGAVAQTADGLEIRWPVVEGLSLPVARATISWNAPGVIWLSCLAGPPGSSRPCTASQLVDVPTPRMTQLNLETGDQIVGILGLTEDSGVAPSVELKPRWSFSRSFTAAGTPLWLALGIVALGVLAAFLLWWTRGRDTDAGRAVSVDPLVDVGDGRVTVAPPGGVRPGQMGTLVDEHADVVDVAATVVDLATRNYLFVEEIARSAYGRMDWRLSRRNPPGDELLAYEREILEAVFAAGDDVLVTDLPDLLRERLAGIQGLMYDDVVGQGWFSERPDSVRSRWTTAGWVLAAAGVVLTLVLALAGTYGLVGLAVILSGVALTLSGQLAPARTSKGTHLLRELAEFRRWVERPDVGAVPNDQREQVISRLYPYALVFGLDDQWAGRLAALDEDPDPDAPLYWYGAPADWHLSDAASSLQHLAATLNAAIGSRSLLASADSR